MKIKLTYLFVLVLNAFFAQVLIPTYKTAFEKQHSFNSEIIKKHGIKKITFEIVDKKDFEAVVDKNLTETYEFDTNGYLSRFYYTTIVKTVERTVPTIVYHNRRKHTVLKTFTDYIYDTISINYIYHNNLLALKRNFDGINYYESRYFKYDTNKNIVKETRYKETNNSLNNQEFILGNQVLLSMDSMNYIKFNPYQSKCIYFNNENRPYKENYIYSDSSSHVIKMVENYVAASWIVQEQIFKYDKNKLISAEFKGNANISFTKKVEFVYDNLNELYTEKHYKNDMLVKEISYVSDKQNGLLNSYVERDPINKSLKIVKLKYDFGWLSVNQDSK
ncbi:MAG: hypothetical protein LCH32_12255 [Bacteroidetes bacterium]|nr:hypothetical protein [Bacteroidota bacterium]